MAKAPLTVIDVHARCGIIDRSWPQPFEAYARQPAWPANDSPNPGIGDHRLTIDARQCEERLWIDMSGGWRRPAVR